MTKLNHSLQQGIKRLSIACLSLLLASCQMMPSARPKPLSSYDDQVQALLAKMTLEEKIGQMIQLDQEHLKDPRDIETYFIGSVLSGGNSDPKAGNSLKNWADMYDGYQRHALNTRLGIPILYGVDAVHGHNNVLDAVIFPHNIGIGCTRNPMLVQEMSRITALEMRATGVQWTFAPCVTVPRDDRWGRTYEGFSEDPAIAALLGQAAVQGFQGRRLSDPLSVAACAKHYIGDGGTTAQIIEAETEQNGEGNKIKLDQGNTEIDEAGLREIHLPPYIDAVNAGVATIMPSYSSWNGLKCSASKYLLTDVLKEELGFEGFLISDYRAIDQVHSDYKTAIGISVNAGMDMGMIPSKHREFFKNLKELVQEGVVPVSRIDDAVTRILRVKYAMGLLDPERSQLTDRSLWASFGADKHRQVARQAVRESLVLLKNDKQTLPLSKKAQRIHVAGDSTQNIGDQCGGWTIDWQGKSGKVTTGGTTILEAIQNTVPAGTKVTYTKDGSGAAGADVVVVVVGEKPYAEFMGDSADLSLSTEDKAAVTQAKQAGIPVVVILLSGRPLVIPEILEQSDALVAAWLPGTEGQGVADVIFGDFKPKGKLSFSWPRSAEQHPINAGDDSYDPLFELGYGLSY
jgi:beta-glucosidase